MPNPVDFFPFFCSFLAAADFITDLGIKNFGATSCQRIKAGVAQRLKGCFQGKFKDALGEMPYLDGRKRLDMHARIEFAKPSQQYEVPFTWKRRVETTHHVHLRNSMRQRASR